MKVNDPKQNPVIETPARAGAAPSPASLPSGAEATISAERVSTGDTSQLKDAVATGRQMAAGERALRLAALAQQVRSGGYRPNVSQLAEEILAQAELDARLAHSLG